MTETFPAPEATPIDLDIEAALDASREARAEALLEFARIPSVSCQPEHAGDMRNAAEWVAERLRGLGATDVEVVETALHPIVYGRIHEAEGAPTALVYCHYDVQPVDPVELWETAPWEPFLRDGRFVGRGVADDKGQLVMHLSALEAMRAAGRTPAVNLTFVFEGEEEFGSESLYTWIDTNRDKLAADYAIISDTGFFEGNLPAITVGLRGIMYAQIDVELAPVDLHSGMYGGTVQNPANALATIIAALKGPDGRIRIPGFYDDVEPLSEGDRESLAALPFDEDAYREAIPVTQLVGESGWTILENKGSRPTLDVNGMWSGFTGDGAKTIIPAHAHAKLSCRLVAHQDPQKVFSALQRYVADIAPVGVTVTTTYLHGGDPSHTHTDHPVTQAAARAIRAIYGVDPVYIREGGSIPVTAAFTSQLGLPVVLLGFAQPACNAHAPNEWLDLDNFERGTRVIVRLWDEIAAISRDGE
ncbi:MAG TPA: dipeptidase [Candidatus Limnocylindrales bacterium]|jgi:acetylornithine deacetylase/succinyl-diaminopimelate desuccinylase-like protein|nr:dipeptidase [Candidatus Limnocylindrales bacterium]